MKKLFAAILLIALATNLVGCKNTNKDTDFADGSGAISEIEEINASADVLLWAQSEIDMLVRMLTVDGFYKDKDYSGGLQKIVVLESRITNLQLAKQLAFRDATTIDLYRFDFEILPQNLVDDDLFVVNDEGWIVSDQNFGYSDASGGELQTGQLYLVLHNSDGVLSGLGIRRSKELTDQWCADLLANYNYPPGVHFDQASVQGIVDYWKWEEEWSFTMPCTNGYGETWNVGLGDSYEFGLGIPYEFIGYKSEPGQDMVAYSFERVERRYYEGLSIVSLTGFYGDQPDEPGLLVNQYISCRQPDCKTARGIHVGNTVQELNTAYPEAFKVENYGASYEEESGIAMHDSCWAYAPEHTNRSILFLVKDDRIVQIDMADGLDGQYMYPAGTGVYQAEE